MEELTREQALDELDVLATVEHALVVEYLSVSYALMPPPNATAPDPAASAAAGAARGLAEREMRHLHQVNGALTRAGRAVQVGRASSIGRGTGEIALGPPTAAQLEHLREREHAIASAVDARYARICDALAAEDPLFFCPDHVEPLADLQSHLGRREPSEFLHTTCREPDNELQRTLLEVSDRHYALIVATVRASFAHEDQLGNELLNRAQTTMDVLDSINQLLVDHGLLPAFTL